MVETFNSIGFAGAMIAVAIMLFAGFTKGAVGFGLPMIVVSGFGSYLNAEIAISAMILPGLATNIWQSLRNGLPDAGASLLKYWRINLVLVVTLFFSARLVVITPDEVLFLILGSAIIVFGGLQLVGWRPTLTAGAHPVTEGLVGLVGGIFGGLAGVWGPPILFYLMARQTRKEEQVRVQGISFLLGSMVLVVAHGSSGVLNAGTVSFSAMMVVPAIAGMWLGLQVQNRIDQKAFRKATLVVLVLAGANLIRRGVG